jgi:hypothetical protein
MLGLQDLTLSHRTGVEAKVQRGFLRLPAQVPFPPGPGVAVVMSSLASSIGGSPQPLSFMTLTHRAVML